MDVSELIAGSCAAKDYKPRQVREEAAVVIILCAAGLPGYQLLKNILSREELLFQKSHKSLKNAGKVNTRGKDLRMR